MIDSVDVHFVDVCGRFGDGNAQQQTMTRTSAINTFFSLSEIWSYC